MNLLQGLKKDSNFSQTLSRDLFVNDGVLETIKELQTEINLITSEIISLQKSIESIKNTQTKSGLKQNKKEEENKLLISREKIKEKINELKETNVKRRSYLEAQCKLREYLKAKLRVRELQKVKTKVKQEIKYAITFSAINNLS